MTPSAPRIFRLAAGDLRARLAAVLALPAGGGFEVQTTALGGNAWNTASVQCHRIRFTDGRAPLECVEKKLRKVLAVGAFEPVMQAWVAQLQREGQRLRTPHLGVIDTPRATFLYSQNVSGAHAHLARMAPEAGAGIAESEAASASALCAAPPAGAWRLDFFRPWTLQRPRYHLGRALRRADDGHKEVARLVRAMQPHLQRMAREAQASPPCSSHLDLISKNLIVNERGLHLIDWGEGRIGRYGFDAGSYLHRLLRANEMRVFEAARATFLQSYFAHLPADVDARQVRRNMLFFLALRTACHFLRPDVLRADASGVGDKLAWLRAQIDPSAG